jgi:response regulator NasT
MTVPHPLKVLIADGDPLFTFCLRAQLANLGHEVVGEAVDGWQAISLTRQLHPDLAVMDIRLPVIGGLEVCRQIDQESLCPVIVLSTHSDPELIEAARLPSIQAFLIKPVGERILEPAIELAVERFRHTVRLRQEATSLKDILNTRSALKRATTYLTTHYHCSPQEALNRIQQEARAKRARLEEVATAIVTERTIDYRHNVPI